MRFAKEKITSYHDRQKVNRSDCTAALHAASPYDPLSAHIILLLYRLFGFIVFTAIHSYVYVRQLLMYTYYAVKDRRRAMVTIATWIIVYITQSVSPIRVCNWPCQTAR